MRLRNGVAACAVSALAMVFSVQQGEHGPLVVYKLEVPKSQPAQGGTAPQAVAPISLETVIMPASALPPPRVTPIPVAVPRTAPRPAIVTPLPRVTGTLAAEAPAGDVRPASLQPRVIGTVAVSEIEALTAYESLPLIPDSGDAFRVVEGSEFGTAMISEDTGDSLTLEEVNNAAVWRRDTAERLRQIPIAPRF